MRSGHPPLNWLKAFEAAARHGSFTAAAAELHVTPSAVSQHVRALELRLSRKLFDRGANGIALTSLGGRYAEGLGRAFALIAQATAELAGTGGHEVLIVRVPTSFASQWIAPRLDLFRAAHPEFDLRLTALGPSLEQAGGAIDAEIRYGWGDWPKLSAVELMHDDVFPVCALALAAGLRKLVDLARHELLHVPGYAEDWEAWLGLAGVEGIETGKGSFFDQSIMAIRAAMEGKGVMLGRSSLIERELAAGRLVAPFPQRLHSTGAYWLVATPAKGRTAKVAAFRDWLQAMARTAAPRRAA